MNLHKEILKIADNAREAAQKLALLSTEQKNTILQNMAKALDKERPTIKAANNKDVEAAKKSGLSATLVDRLQLTDVRIDTVIQSLCQISELADPVGQIINETVRPNGLVIRKVRVPIGVIGIIYESRPNVTADVAALCLKTANAVILRGGIDAMHSNRAILHALLQVKMPEYAMQLITIPDRDAIKELVQLTGKVDLIIPRGGEGLIKTVVDLAKVPVIKHYQGICHVYVDVDADLNKALAICENAKCQRPGVCNAMETLLVHEKIATQFLPKIAKILTAQQVKLKGDAKTQNIIPNIEPATAQDWETEYLDLILSIKVVTDINEAIQHINYYGSHHSDAIITENKKTAERFTTEVDSAAVYVNASTRFTDGAEFGMGAEMGISTDKLHARGPMGLEELTTYKYVILGTGQIRN
jgi:glutamate-5-semialdehyde dehydrogenase